MRKAVTPTGIEPWRKPAVFVKIRILRGCFGRAGAFSGRAASIFLMMSGLTFSSGSFVCAQAEEASTTSDRTTTGVRERFMVRPFEMAGELAKASRERL